MIEDGDHDPNQGRPRRICFKKKNVIELFL